MKKFLGTLVIFLCLTGAFAQNTPLIEQGYWSITSANKTIGAAGYSLQPSSDGWIYNGWTVLKIAAVGKEHIIRIFFQSKLAPDMTLLEYNMSLADSILLEAKMIDDALQLSMVMQKTSSAPISNEEKEHLMKEKSQGDATGSPTNEKSDKMPIQKTQEQTPSVAKTLQISNPVFLLDLNVFPHWQILAKKFFYMENMMQSFTIVVPQILKTADASVTVGHRERIGDHTYITLSFAGDHSFATAWVDSASGILQKLELPREKFAAEFSDTCPDTTTITSLELSSAILRPESKIKGSKILENPFTINELHGTIDIELTGKPNTKTVWQTFEGNYEAKRLTGKFSSIRTEFSGKGAMQLSDLPSLPTSFAPYLAISSDIPAHNDAIADISKRWIKQLADAETVWEYAVMVTQWISDNVKHDPNQNDAIVAAATRRGNSLAKAKLLCSVLRTRGIPARVAGGVYLFGEVWLPHFWVEAYCGEKAAWHPLDPSTGETKIFSPLHLALFADEATLGEGTITFTKIK